MSELRARLSKLEKEGAKASENSVDDRVLSVPVFIERTPSEEEEVEAKENRSKDERRVIWSLEEGEDDFKGTHTWEMKTQATSDVVRRYNCSSKSSGRVANEINCSISNASDNSYGGVFLEAYHGFGYRNRFQTGRLKITASYIVNRIHTHQNVNENEDGWSGLFMRTFVKFRMRAYLREDGETLGEQIFHGRSKVQWLDWNDGEHNSANLPHPMYNPHDTTSTPITISFETTGVLPKGKWARFYVGIWSGAWLGANDFSLDIGVSMDAVLQRVECETI